MSTPFETIGALREIYSVSRLNREARLLLSMSFPLLWVEGEISNLSAPASGHLYFTLKDDAACVRCAMFKSQNLYLRFRPQPGMSVLVRARVSLYEPRGEFQLTVEHMEEAGHGALQRAFEALKQKLAAEGLFEPGRRKALPKFPRRLGVVTSPLGAAIRDILSVLRRRLPTLPVLIYPVPVQGEAAAPAIADALAGASRRGECDVLIIARGGGSLEDLWAFNTEMVARAIAACQIPVVSGVGHEIDFTIADLAADYRAATPTAAAELVSPDKTELLSRLDQVERYLRQCEHRWREAHARKLDWLSRRLDLQHPRQRLQRLSQHMDDLEQRLRLATRYMLRRCAERLSELDTRARHCSPRVRLAQTTARWEHVAQCLDAEIRRSVDARRQRIDNITRTLHTLSPLATLDRGYAIVNRASDSLVLRDSKTISVGEAVRIRLARGQLSAEVTVSDDSIPAPRNAKQ
jgi:exodeoxyribonuclease VII large subunit